MMYHGLDEIFSLVLHPVETALASQDEVIHLLLALGASVNIGPKKSVHRFNPDMWMSLLDWVQLTIRRIPDSDDTSSLDEPPAPGTSGWEECLAKLRRGLLALTDAQNRRRQETGAHCDEVKRKRFLIEMESLLISHGAKTRNEIYTDRLSPFTTTPGTQVPPNTRTESKYLPFPAGHSYMSPIPQRLESSYDELYEACFTGDNEKVERLCLSEDAFGLPSLQIAVQTSQIPTPLPVIWSQTRGYSPLHAAVVGRRWGTARLVLQIAAAQYSPKVTEPEAFNVTDIQLSEYFSIFSPPLRQM